MTIGPPLLFGDRVWCNVPAESLQWDVLRIMTHMVRVMVVVRSLERYKMFHMISVASIIAALQSLELDAGDGGSWATLEALEVEAYLSHHAFHLAVTEHSNLFLSMAKSVNDVQHRRSRLRSN